MESLQGIDEVEKLEVLLIYTKAKNKNIEPILGSKNLKKLFLPISWGKDNLLKIDHKYPHLRLSQYIKEVEEFKENKIFPKRFID